LNYSRASVAINVSFQLEPGWTLCKW